MEQKEIKLPTKTRKKKPFSAKGKSDLDELLARLLESKVQCPLAGCTDTFVEIQKDLAKIRQKLDTFLGNGHEGLFQALEDKVENNTGRLYRLERWGYALIAGLMVLNIAIQVILRHWWIR